MNTRKTLLLAVSFFAIMIVIYLLCITVPDIAEYASKAHLFEEPREGYVWKDWVLEAREMFWKALIGLILQICFFTSVAFWSFYEATGKRVGSPFTTKTEEKDEQSKTWEEIYEEQKKRELEDRI